MAQSGSVPAAPSGAPQNNAAAATAIQSPGTTAAPVQNTSENVMVTGSILRNPNLSGANPVTTLTATDLKRRGISTVAQALQTVTANGAGNLPANFSGNGAFASGASGVSLRGLTTDSTLVLIDGQRAAYYPLSDDGERSFVDTNSIPQSIIQSIDVQQDGGSATYGADAVAGVVNIITRKQIEGFEGGAEGGLTQRGDGGHQRLYATYGYGDLDRDNFNIWLNGEYQQDDLIRNSDRGFPYNTENLSSLNGSNGNPNGLNGDGSFAGLSSSGVRVALVRPVTIGAGGALTSQGLIQPINPQLGCDGLATHVVARTGTVCEQNLIGDYYIIQPSDRRISSTLKGTANLSADAQAYAMFTYSQNQVYFPHRPDYITNHSSSGDVSLANITLPVRLANGQLNPNDPFAAQGFPARIYYRFGDLIPQETDYNQTFRGSSGVNGSIGSSWGGDWHYNVDVVGMVDSLRRTITNVPTFQGILNAVSTGSYNFVDPSQNSQAVRSAVAPTNVIQATSQEFALDVILSKGLFELPGGMTTLGVGGQARYESLNDPSATPDDPLNPNAQYLRTINPFSAAGSRKVGSTFFELGIPFVKQFTADVSGRYDNYSEGFDNFAPKVGVIFKPIPLLTLRGTYSKGFRVPSFAETGGLNYGYVSSPPLPASFLAMHETSAGTPDAYATAPSFALRTVGNPNLKPEHSDNFTGGVIVQPKPWISLSADSYYIKKNDYVVTSDSSAPLAAYYAGLNPPGVLPDVTDPDHPDAMPRAGTVDVTYINAASLVTDGFDLQLSTRAQLPGRLSDITWISSGTATYIDRYNITYPGVGTERYAGTLGPYNVTSASGTPRWRASWLNTFIYNRLTVGVATYYTSGYRTTAEDITGPNTAGDCANALVGFTGAPMRCGVNSFWDVDLTFNYAVTPGLHLYTNVYNVADARPPFDTGTYGSYLYNPSWAAAGILGRSFRFGVTDRF
ncbi:TonB-dependent receptor domain-containing protein [Lichenicoccus sp.]|uniref:TonB-dependent receptor domain-containing protein n=1 Tax=Lichenicoccus sp. TaxID=2781899 RepID=UPI003D096413